jgi:hypothetical protein
MKRTQIIAKKKGISVLEIDCCEVAKIDWLNEQVIVKVPKYVGLNKFFISEINKIAIKYRFSIIYK